MSQFQSHRPGLFGWLLVLLVSVPGVSADVFVVDIKGGPGSDFVQISDAVAAALDGDVILVRDGDYAAFTVTGKGLTITADHGARIRFTGRISILGVPPGSSLSLRGFDTPNDAVAGHLDLLANGGPVLIEDCNLLGPENLVPTAAAIHAHGGSTVSIVDCTLGVTACCGSTGVAGLQVDNATVFLRASTVTSGNGVHGQPFGVPVGGDGGPAVVVNGGILYVDDSSLTGGIGGHGAHNDFVFPCGNGGSGGPGLRLTASNSRALLRDAVLVGGGSGPADSPCAAGPAGPPSEVVAGVVSTLTGGTRTLAFASPVRELETSTATIGGGGPGELLYLLLSAGAPITILPLGPTPLSGQITFAAPVLTAGVEGVAVQIQAAFLDAVGTVRTSNGTQLVLLDGSL